ncbi:uncharacterized protein LOC117109887 isoform X2 [Anneissia japonica]|uniref:uncharacterized protein LOC117109887 isoform X2 n=1 Tax=Anneissia japonica TaxID=1529436 RepID=UPI001425B1AF|nr:uncharacterized protein LOC117109887 isoform X2 [Anneissia japonica]
MHGVISSREALPHLFLLLFRLSSVTPSGCDDGACQPQTVQIYQIPTTTISVLPSNVTCNELDCKFNYTSNNTVPALMIDYEVPTEYTTWSTKVWFSSSSIPEIIVTIAFGKDHSMEDDLIVTFLSELPDAMTLEKSSNYGETWDTLQYYSTNCSKDFALNESYHSSDVKFTTDVICVNPFNEQVDEDVNHIYFLVKPRLELLSPGLSDPNELYEGLERDIALRQFLNLTDLRIRMLRPTFQNETSYDRGNSASMLYMAYLAISNIQTSLSCNCNLHGSYCTVIADMLSCNCHHNTEGRSCELCKPDYDLIPWQPGSFLPLPKGTANSCQPVPLTTPILKATTLASAATSMSICATNPCINDGTCQETNNGYSCQCTNAYTGNTCESEVNPCDSNPCTSGDLTICNKQNNGYICTEKQEEKSGISTKTIIIISGVSGGVVLFFAWVCFIIYWATYREKPQKMNRKSQKYNVQTAKKSSDLLIPDGLSSQRVHELQEKWDVKESNLLLGKLLSSGKFSYVCEGSMKEDDTVVETKVAVKLLKDESDEASKNEILNEFSILSTVGKNNNTVQLLGMCSRTLEQSTQLCLVMEFVARGNMQRILRRCRSRRRDQPAVDPLPEDELLGYANDVILGLKHLDSLGILHMNVCAKNVLITFNNKAKICDFGRAVEIQEPDQYTKYKPHHDEQKKRWMAYEATIEGIYNSKSEVWSYGMLLYEIVTLGGIPYADIKLRNLKEKLKEHYRMEWPRHCSQDLYNLMLSCWHRRPESRPSINLVAKEIKLFKSASKKHMCLKDYPFQTYIAIKYPEDFDDPMALQDSFV